MLTYQIFDQVGDEQRVTARPGENRLTHGVRNCHTRETPSKKILDLIRRKRINREIPN